MKKQIAIVTGANSGFGKELVKLLVKEQDLDEIWAIARNKERLEQLTVEFGAKIKTMSLDLTDRKCFDLIKEKLDTEDVNIKYLVNNAGFGKFCSYKELDVSETLKMTDLNINALAGLSILGIPYMSEGSHIINIASQAGFFPLPYLNVYSATKAFVLHYTQALNMELKGSGISATAVCPGWMSTNFIDNCKIGAEKEINNFFGITAPARVAQKALNDAKASKSVSFSSLWVRLSIFLSKFVSTEFMMKFWLKFQNIK